MPEGVGIDDPYGCTKEIGRVLIDCGGRSGTAAEWKRAMKKQNAYGG